jgi:multidrug efflux pump subunit AcrB
MFNRWIDGMVTRTKWVNIITIVIALLGIAALWKTKRDLHPPFQFNIVRVTVELPDTSPAEIERLITYPIEETLLSIPDLKKITAKTSVGHTTIRLEFTDKVKNLNDKVEDIRSRIQTVVKDLPQEIRNVSVQRDRDEDIFLANYGIQGVDEKNPLHHLAIDKLKRDILAVKGVSKVDSSLRPLLVYIRFSPDKLNKEGISPSLIQRAIQSHFQFQTLGFHKDQSDEWLMEMSGAPVSVEEIKKIPLFQNAQERKLLLGDLTTVELDQPPLTSYNFLLNGEQTVELVLFKDIPSDSIELFERVKAQINQTKMPEGVTLKLLYDGPYFIKQQIDVLTSNGFGGLILVLIMLALAMSWRTSLMTALGLPISYFGTFIILFAFGMSIDLISLIAMILVVGNLVDDAVIMAERYTQLLEEGLPPEAAAAAAAKELIVPVTGTILTIICAFLPIVLVEGNLSKIFAAIPVVVAAALLLSWFETFFILPNHLAHFVKTPPKMGSQKFFHRLARSYRHVLSHTLKWRYLYGATSIALLVFTVFVAKDMPQDFDLYLNAPQVEIYAEMKDGTTLEQAREALMPLHQHFQSLDKSEVDFIETNIGWVWRQGKAYRGTKYATIRLILNKESTDPKELRDHVLIEVQKQVDAQKAKFVKLEAIANERGAGNRQTETTTVRISGKDERAFAAAEQAVIVGMAAARDSKDIEKKDLIGDHVVPDDQTPLTYRFQPDRGRVTSLNLSPNELAYQVRAQTSSIDLLRTRSQGTWTSIILEPQQLKRPELTELALMRVVNPETQSIIPVAYLGTWEKLDKTAGISHENGERILNVQFNFDGTKTNEQVVRKYVSELLLPISAQYPQLKIESVDSNENDKRGREWTFEIITVAAIMIYLILALVLKSFALPLIVGLPIPFAMVGVIWALKAHDFTLSLMAMIGLIGTMGVAVNDSIVMVDQIQRLKLKYGKLTKEIILDGAASRLRAIVLTATCTLIGVFPTAYGAAGESNFTQPLAFSMGWGLTTSLLLTLFIIPAMLQVFEDISQLFRVIFKRKTVHSMQVQNQELAHELVGVENNR